MRVFSIPNLLTKMFSISSINNRAKDRSVITGDININHLGKVLNNRHIKITKFYYRTRMKVVKTNYRGHIINFVRKHLKFNDSKKVNIVKMIKLFNSISNGKRAKSSKILYNKLKH